MSNTRSQHLSRPAACLPLVFGLSALVVWTIYLLQRSGMLSPHSFERFVQRHLDAVAITSFVLAAVGIALGLYLGRGGRQTKLMLWGILICVAGALAQLFLPL
jgi:hypothetical protein